jgi:hypothetical protein
MGGDDLEGEEGNATKARNSAGVVSARRRSPQVAATSEPSQSLTRMGSLADSAEQEMRK